jgi:hypothetical protein
MSVMDKLKGLFHSHEDQAQKGMDKATQVADDKTGGKYGSQFSQGEQAAEREFGIDPTQSPPDPQGGTGGQP